MTTILGIDPGSRLTGYGVIKSDGKTHEYMTSGVIRVLGDDLGTKLQCIFDGIRELMMAYRPEEAGIEQVFMHRNAGAALKLGQARGVALVAASVHGIPVAEYSARQVKQAVVGHGAAKKEQVQHMIRYILNLSQAPSEDAADALAVAICHANTQAGLAGIQGATAIRKGRIR